MITELGKQLRRIRWDNNERLYDMAHKLSVSSAFLSNVERGKKQPPPSFLTKIITAYSLSEDQKQHIASLFTNALQSFTLRSNKPEAQKTAAVLARRFDELSDEDLKQIRKLAGGS